jgi:sterol desaturase/sphingolipid hydroxylase (fatty acid hydroxylase superfamily)
MEYFFSELHSQVSVLLGYPLDSGKRIYLIYLLGSLVLVLAAMTFYAIRHDRAQALELWRSLTSPRIWLHSSARLDYQLLAINPLVRVFVFGTLGVSLAPVALATSNVLGHWFESLSFEWPDARVTAAYTLALFVADDFSRFLLHYLMHKVPALWSIHRLHHSAEVMTPFTVYRIHPLESLLYSTRMVLTQGVVLGVFFFAFGMKLSVWEIAGANSFTYLFNLVGANLRHSHVWISWGPWLERVFISPAQHQIHHSNNPVHFDRNMGACLAIWDGLFKTLCIAKAQKVTGFGLRRGHASPHGNLFGAYVEPCAHLWRCATKARAGNARHGGRSRECSGIRPGSRPLETEV